eukprot:scaffold1377_cov126-Cylindrotheca_fusiformis.AAC.24
MQQQEAQYNFMYDQENGNENEEPPCKHCICRIFGNNLFLDSRTDVRSPFNPRLVAFEVLMLVEICPEMKLMLGPFYHVLKSIAIKTVGPPCSERSLVIRRKGLGEQFYPKGDLFYNSVEVYKDMNAGQTRAFCFPACR